MKKQLVRSHRTMGYEITRTPASNGREFVILQTGLAKEEVTFAHMLMPVSDAEIAFEVGVWLIDAILKARFLGLDNDALRSAFETAINIPEE